MAGRPQSLLDQRTVVYVGAYVAGIAVLGYAAQQSFRLFLWTVVLLVAVVVALHLRFRPPEPSDRRLLSLLVGAALIGLGGWLLVAWAGGASDWQGFVGAGLAVFGYRMVMRQIRSWCEPMRYGAAAYMAIGVVLTIVAIGWIVATLPTEEGPVDWLPVILGAVLMVSGLALFSEGLLVGLRSKPIRWTWALGIAGVVVFVGVLAWLWSEDVGWQWLLVIGVVVLVGVGSIVSESDYDVAGMIVVAALLWAVSPSSVPAPTVIPGDDRPVMVAIGDSYISGEGATAFYEGTNVRPEEAEGAPIRRNECRRAPTAFPELVAGEESRLVTTACSAARIVHVDGRAQYRGEPGFADTPNGLDQLDHVDRSLADAPGDVDVVLVTIGGNDAGFAEIGPTCIAPGDCTAVARIWLDELAPLQGRLEAMYTTIKGRFGGDVPIVVVPYPGPISPLACPASALTGAEHRFLAGFTAELQGVIEAAAASAGVHHLAEVEDALEAARMRICDSGDRGVNFIGLNPIDAVGAQSLDPATWVHNSLHPNAIGHAELARVVEQNLPDGPNPEPEPTPYAIRSLEDLMGDEPIAGCDVPECADVGDWRTVEVRSALRRAGLLGFAMATGAWMIWVAAILTLRRRHDTGAPAQEPPRSPGPG